MIDWTTPDPLYALTHFDGRNGDRLTSLRPYFSEFAWMQKRLSVMIEYLIWIVEVLNKKKLSALTIKHLRAMATTFSLQDAKKIQRYESRVNHDLKAIELFLTAGLKGSSLRWLGPFINLGIGSEDINSIALGVLLSESRGEVILPAIRAAAKHLISLVEKERETWMVARTHAQPANVTTFGKELAVPLLRLCDEVELFQNLRFAAKCSGEVGSFQALWAVRITGDWISLTDDFVSSLGLQPSHATTQIVPYEHLVRYLQSLFRINAIFLDLVKNLWLSVLLGHIRVLAVGKEVGSAGMPHKVNPTYLEGAEGGLEFANGAIEALARKLPMNRLQRDFSDSTARRNVVVPLAYSLLSYQSIAEGLPRLTVDRDCIADDLANHPEIWTETIKAYGLICGVDDIYERLKMQTRGKVSTREDIHGIIDDLPLTSKNKQTLKKFLQAGRNPYPVRIASEGADKARKFFHL